MRPYQIFASMTPEEALHFFQGLGEGSPAMLAQMVHAAASAMKSRPAYVQKLAKDKKANAMRRALARVGADPLAEEMLAIYFLECRKELLGQWLDSLGIEHEDGTLKEEQPEQPTRDKLSECIAQLRASAEDDGGRSDRELLLRAFAAQSAIDWPELDGLLDTEPS